MCTQQPSFMVSTHLFVTFIPQKFRRMSTLNKAAWFSFRHSEHIWNDQVCATSSSLQCTYFELSSPCHISVTAVNKFRTKKFTIRFCHNTKKILGDALPSLQCTGFDTHSVVRRRVIVRTLSRRECRTSKESDGLICLGATTVL